MKGKHCEKCISTLNLLGQIILSGPNGASLPSTKVYISFEITVFWRQLKTTVLNCGSVEVEQCFKSGQP